jgi:hypothetical protein
MTILLDAGPLGMVSNPKASRRNRDCYDWLLSTIADGTRVLVPEIADYEVRRKGKCLTLIGTEGTLIEEIIVDAHGEDEQLWAFRQVMEDEVPLPIDGFVLGEPVAIVEIAYDGNERRGLTARCRRNEGSEHVVSLADVQVARQAKAARYVAAYRKWLGLEPAPAEGCGSSSRAKAHKAADEDIRLDGPVELVVLSVKDRAVRCRLANSTRVVTLRSGRLWTIVPGQIISVRPSKHWRYAGHPYLSGEMETARIDAQGLGLVPLRLHEQGDWDPAEEYWGEGPIEAWAQPIISRGPRPMYEMEQVLPGADPDNWDSDPITESNDRKDAGDIVGARNILCRMLEADLRCLDAHAHLGNMVFDRWPDEAMRHYEIGVRIGELSLGGDFNGVLAWGLIDNRPFLRCLHGYALCLWRLKRFAEAEGILSQMLWLNPSDNQGARIILPAVQSGEDWEPERW